MFSNDKIFLRQMLNQVDDNKTKWMTTKQKAKSSSVSRACSRLIRQNSDFWLWSQIFLKVLVTQKQPIWLFKTLISSFLIIGGQGYSIPFSIIFSYFKNAILLYGVCNNMKHPVRKALSQKGIIGIFCQGLLVIVSV